MASSPAKKGNLLQFALIFLLVFLGTEFLFRPATKEEAPAPGLTLAATSRSFSLGHHPELTLTNVPASTTPLGPIGWIESKVCGLGRLMRSNKTQQQCRSLARTETGQTAKLPDRCPRPPLDLFRVENPGSPEEKLAPITSEENTIPCVPTPDLLPGDTVTVSLAPWKYALFEQPGVTYEARLPGTEAPKVSASGSAIAPVSVVRFSVVEPGAFVKLFRTFVTAPLLNLLVLIASVLPGHSLGFAIILLTLLIKILLFLPTQHAMEGQKKMQLLQPRIQELQKKHEGDQKRIHEETMKLWKEHKINPLSSCLPMLLQFPILIGLFYTVRDGSTLSLSRHLTYEYFQNLGWHFDTTFFGLDLLTPEIFFAPILLVLMQFFQMKLSFAIQKRKTKAKSADAIIDIGKPAPASPGPEAMQQRMMLYVLPLMIGVFAIQFPAAVSLYWGVSTLFAIAQQMIVNREHLRV